MRILEFLELNGEQNVSEIMQGIDCNQLKTSQYLKRLRDDGFVSCHRDGKFVIYNITKGVHKTAIQCIHNRYDKLNDKTEF